ncbi:hypothetical protein LUW76_38910 [Actinomadura madurae]|uniref:hypothetical protein n=1 Tax=Actinomadura madurae TaxID=1993 RepID=UPI002027006B|nr:hypothetical protein [Actinomadura madurae]URM99815.1 hypothetical protein LUW76_38910 [Actinomadura madurae]URN01978.1 hypothetical protein LUW74_00310 [Actinomadura madurae]
MISTLTLLWIFGPAALFLTLALYVALMGYRTRDLQFRSRMAAPTPAVGRRGALVNVAVPADRTPPADRPRTASAVTAAE